MKDDYLLYLDHKLVYFNLGYHQKTLDSNPLNVESYNIWNLKTNT